jgi:hypothetical protein
MDASGAESQTFWLPVSRPCARGLPRCERQEMSCARAKRSAIAGGLFGGAAKP